ncbi:MAG TPA: dephospho-CoA kinase, partial [Burkholderiales bacterium]|nr:dephospho-CoA kinase [Burkholderiales bacterium]
ERLERILHPRIRQEVEARIASAHAPYLIVVVPLLLETGAYKALVKRVLVVDCDEALQIARATQRSGLTGEEVRAVMSAQLSRAARLAAADDVLSNDSDMDALRRGAQGLHAKYLALAAQHSASTAPTSGNA